MKTKLEADGSNQKLLLDYIENNASENLVQRINAGNKTLNGCWNFILAEARKLAVKGCACVEDVEVYGWAMHYFEEDSIKECETAPAAAVSSSEKKEEPIKNEPKTSEPKKKKTINADQMSMLDLFG